MDAQDRLVEGAEGVRIGAVLAVVLAGACAGTGLYLSCSGPAGDAAGAGQDSGGPAPGDAGSADGSETEETDGTKDARDGGDADVKDQQTVDGIWTPPGDPGWVPVSWAKCKAQFGTIPSNAVPPLVWNPCSGVGGCSRLFVNWTYHQAYPFMLPQVYKKGPVVRIGIRLWWAAGPFPKQDLRWGLYDETMAPIAAWRADATNLADCAGQLLRWTDSHVCMVLVSSAAGGFDDGFLDTTQLNKAIFVGSTNTSHSDGDCSDQIFATVPLGESYGWDIPAKKQFSLATPQPALVWKLNVFKDNVFLLRKSANQTEVRLDGWIWTRTGGTAELYAPPPGEWLFDIRTDGTSLLWVQGHAKSTDYPSTDSAVYRSPFATTQTGVKPQKLRDGPPVKPGPYSYVAGGGYYALHEIGSDFKDTKTHVYRISDGRHWLVPTPADIVTSGLLLVDAEEIWYVGFEPAQNVWNTLVRQRLSDLGPGD